MHFEQAKNHSTFAYTWERTISGSESPDAPSLHLLLPSPPLLLLLRDEFGLHHRSKWSIKKQYRNEAISSWKHLESYFSVELNLFSVFLQSVVFFNHSDLYGQSFNLNKFLIFLRFFQGVFWPEDIQGYPNLDSFFAFNYLVCVWECIKVYEKNTILPSSQVNGLFRQV